MSSEKKVCDSCNAVAHSDAEFCRECGTALPSIPTNSSELLARAKIALARADYKDVLRACAAAKLLDPDNAEVSQIMAAAHTALDVLRDEKPGEGNAAHVQGSNPHRNKSKTRKRLHWGRWALIISLLIVVVAVGRSFSDKPIDKSIDKSVGRYRIPTATPEAVKEDGCSSIEGFDIEARDEFGGTLLHMAAEKNTLDVARQLIDSGAGIEARDKSGDAPLHKAAESNSLDIARLLIDRCADIEAKSHGGWTPLHKAAESNSLDVASLLIDSGADIEANVDHSGWTPLHWATTWGSLDVVQLLIDSGADIEADTRSALFCRIGFCGSPLHLAASAYHYGDRDQPLDIARLLIDSGADIEANDNDGKTPLHIAAWNNSLDIARLLIDSGADIEAKDNDGRTPLYEAATDWMTNDGDHSLHVATLLIDRGADIEAKDNDGWKPLHEAVANNSLQVARSLIYSGANTDGIDLSWMD